MQKILNYINGEWIEPKVKEYFDVINPATGELMARTPLCGFDEVDSAAKAAAAAFPGLAADSRSRSDSISLQAARPAQSQHG